MYSSHQIHVHKLTDCNYQRKISTGTIIRRKKMHATTAVTAVHTFIQFQALVDIMALMF